VSALTAESALSVIGTVVADERVKLGGLELQPQELHVESLAEPELPIAPDSALDKRMDWRYLDLRRPDRRLIFEVQTTVEHAMREVWRSEQFIELHTPKFMGSASESGAELFKVEYFDGVAYLAQSPQFYKQMAMAAGFGRVFEVGPVFRANPSFTSRHDTEFTSVDMELAWISSHYDVMAFEERWLQFVLQSVEDKHAKEIAETFGAHVHVPTIPFPKVTMDEAHAILRAHGIAPPPEGDLDPQGERVIAEHTRQQYDHEFVFVTDYPSSVRAFYSMRYADDPRKSKTFDLLWKGLEVTSGAQREHRHAELVKNLQAKGMRVEPVQFYLDFFRYGCPPHGGFGFGLSRMLMLLMNRSNVREVTYLYRGPNRLTP